MARTLKLLAIGSLLALGGCDDTARQVPADAAAAPEAQGTVTREVTPPPAEPAPAPAPAAAIQTQPGPRGAQVALNKVAVTGDVLTVQVSYIGNGSNTTAFVELDEISLIDDATAQRIGILKDNAGKWLAAPLSGSSDSLAIPVNDTPSIVWMKFPAPPATSRTVSVNIPGVGPFDGVPVTR